MADATIVPPHSSATPSEGARLVGIWRLVRPQLARWAFAVVLVAFVLYPIYRVFRRAFDDFGRVWDKAIHLPSIGETLWNTFYLSVGSVVLALLVGSCLAWCIRFLPPTRAGVGSAIAMFPILIPTIAGTIGWTFMAAPRVGYLNQVLRATPFWNGDTGPTDVYTLPWIVGITAIYMVPYVFLFVSTALRGFDVSLENAARVHGAGWLKTQLRIVVPMIRPAILYAVTIVLLLGLGQFTVPLLLGRQQGIDVITTEMFRQTNTSPVDFPVASFLAMPIVIFAIFAVFTQNRAIGSLSLYAPSRIGQHQSFRTGSAARWAIVPILLYGIVAVLPPLAGLILVSGQGFWSGEIVWSELDLDNFRALRDDPMLKDAILNSLRFSIAGVICAVALCSAIALFLRTGRGVAVRIVEYVINLPLSIPGIVFGMGLFVAFALPPVELYGSSILLILAYVIILLPHGVRMIQSGLSQVGHDVERAARVSGAGPIRTLRSVSLPLLRPSIASAAVLMFVIMTQEFAASVMLRTPGTQVMSTQLLDLFEFGNYSQVAAMALIMVCVSGIGVLAISVLGRHDWTSGRKHGRWFRRTRATPTGARETGAA